MSAVVLAVAGMGALPMRALAGPPVSPYQFRRVAERHRSSLVQVRDVSTPTRWRTGFLIGARGEIVFGSRKRPQEKLRWRTKDNKEHAARLLAYDPKLRLAVARGPIQARVVPLMPAEDPRMRPKRWVVTFRHGRKGRAVPHAGTVSKKRKRWGRVVEVPGQLGAPVLDLKGGLLGVVRTGGRRKAVVLPMDRILPFLKKAVLGERG